MQDITTTPPPPSEPSEQLVLEEIDRTLKRLPALFEAARDALAEGASLGELCGHGPETYEPLHALACKLCDEGRFEEALPVALVLTAFEPHHTGYAIVAASCYQRLGLFESAAFLYGLGAAGGEPAAVFRMGECLGAIGESSKAREAFEEAAELCDGDPERWQLARACADAIQRLDRHPAR